MTGDTNDKEGGGGYILADYYTRELEDMHLPCYSYESNHKSGDHWVQGGRDGTKNRLSPVFGRAE